jgi:COMPASS component SWD3
MMTD